MKNFLINNIYWIIPSIATLFAAILAIVFPKAIKERIKSFRSGNINLKKSNHNNIQIIANQYDNELKSNYKSEQTVIAYHRTFELTDGLIKLSIEAFRPLKFGNPKGFAEYLNEVIDKYNEYVLYFDSKEILFDSDIVKIIHEIREIVLNCIQHQKTIENFKSMKMPWEYITPEIDAINEIYKHQVENELPKLRERLIVIIKNANI